MSHHLFVKHQTFLPLLQKRFVGAGRIAFLGAGAIPTPVSRCYKSRFLGAGKGPLETGFQGRVKASAAPEKGFSGAGNAPDPPLKMSFPGAACTFSRPWKLVPAPPIFQICFPPIFINLFPAKFYQIYFPLLVRVNFHISN